MPIRECETVITASLSKIQKINCQSESETVITASLSKIQKINYANQRVKQSSLPVLAKYRKLCQSESETVITDSHCDIQKFNYARVWNSNHWQSLRYTKVEPCQSESVKQSLRHTEV